MLQPVRIGLLGEFSPTTRSLVAASEAIRHAAAALDLEAECRWLATSTLGAAGSEELLASCDGLWAPAGSPCRNVAGMLSAILFARTHDWPFLGTCGGFQYAVLEYARNVMGMADAVSAEQAPGEGLIVIAPVLCALPDRPAGSAEAPQGGALRVRPGSRLHRVYARESIREDFFCCYEINPGMETRLEAAGLSLTAHDVKGHPRCLEIAAHRFFIGALFQPQIVSRPGHPHPLLTAFVEAASKARDARLFRTATLARSSAM